MHGRYVAPEILKAGVMEGYRNAVDVFSVGAVVYALLCGYEPFYGETDAELKLANEEAEVVFHGDGSPWEQVRCVCLNEERDELVNADLVLV